MLLNRLYFVYMLFICSFWFVKFRFLVLVICIYTHIQLNILVNMLRSFFNKIMDFFFTEKNQIKLMPC